MYASRDFVFAHRSLRVGELAAGLAAAFRAAGLDATCAEFSVSDTLPDGTHTQRDVSFSDLENMVIARASVSVSVRSEEVRLEARYHASADALSLHLAASAPKLIALAREAFQTALHLDPPPPPTPYSGPTIWDGVDAAIQEALAPVLDRVAALESSGEASMRRLRCFLSFRFNDASELLALRVQKFLALVDVDVLTGATYEPRQVTEKVLSRLREPLDFIVILVTADGESMWTRDEIGAALHAGIALVPLVERGAKLEPGLFGDVEYIEFAQGHIGDAFLKLLQAVRFVREQQARPRAGA